MLTLLANNPVLSKRYGTHSSHIHFEQAIKRMLLVNFFQLNKVERKQEQEKEQPKTAAQCDFIQFSHVCFFLFLKKNMFIALRTA